MPNVSEFFWKDHNFWDPLQLENVEKKIKKGQKNAPTAAYTPFQCMRSEAMRASGGNAG